MSNQGSVLEVQPVDLSLEQPYAISSPDGSMTHTVSADTSNPKFTVITAETSFPEGTDRWDVRQNLDPTPLEDQAENSQSELIRLTTQGGFMQEFGDINRFGRVLQALGYDWHTESTTEDSVTSQRAMLTYPSVDELNTRAAQIFPSTPLRFTSFAGGRYTTEEYLTPFAEAGEIIVPAEQPWQLHDHAVKHLLGLLAMGEDFVEPMRAVVKQWLVRDKAEAAFPVVPGIGDRQVDEFLRPARLVLGHVMSKFDIHTSDIAQEILVKPIPSYNAHIRREQWSELERPIERFWNEGKSGVHASHEVPSRVLGRYGYDASLDFAETMWRRYETADENATALVNSGDGR